MIDLNTNSPLIFSEFKKYYTNYSNTNNLETLYKRYLSDYSKNKKEKEAENDNYEINIYKEFLKNIDHSKLPSEVQNFLNKLDYSNPYEVDLCIDYIIKNIQQKFKIFKNHRDELKFIKTKNNLKTSKEGIEIYLRNVIYKTLLLNNVDILSISNDFKININQYVSNDSSRIESDVQSDIFYNIDKDIKTELESRKTFQTLNINPEGENKILSTSNRKISFNLPFTNYNQLPERFFGNEDRNFDNFNTNLKIKLLEKYLETDMYHLSGDGTTYNLTKIVSTKNSNSYYARYNPIISNEYGNFSNKKIIPTQLSYNNSGLAQSLSKNLTFNVNVPNTYGDYLIPDPNKVEPGIGFKRMKSYFPIHFNSNNEWIKNNEVDNINVRDTSSIKTYGYQSQENSLKYSPYGINKMSDEINFWEGSNQNIWKNPDVYERNVFRRNDSLQDDRFSDLKVSTLDNTIPTVPVIIKSDMYGNEFIFLKNSEPKRNINQTTYNQYKRDIDVSITNTEETLEIYDGLYFDDALDSLLSNLKEVKGDDTLTNDDLYDYHITNDNTLCNAGTNSFNGNTMKSTAMHAKGCNREGPNALVEGDDLLDLGDFKQEHNISFEFSNKNTPTSLSYSYPHNNTNIQSEFLTLDNSPSESSTYYNQNYSDAGEILIRDVNSQRVYSLYKKLNIFSKIGNVTNEDIINFDIQGNTLFIQTQNHTFTETYEYDGEEFSFINPSNSLI